MEADLASMRMVRAFVETGETFLVPLAGYPTGGDWPPLCGLELPQEVLAKLYTGNLQHLPGSSPRPLCMELVQEELDRLQALMQTVCLSS
jgi:hypothetical protein